MFLQECVLVVRWLKMEQNGQRDDAVVVIDGHHNVRISRLMSDVLGKEQSLKGKQINPIKLSREPSDEWKSKEHIQSQKIDWSACQSHRKWVVIRAIPQNGWLWRQSHRMGGHQSKVKVIQSQKRGCVQLTISISDRLNWLLMPEIWRHF